jgi:uncharacterized lipoprotein YddW (UPF0748 family)
VSGRELSRREFLLTFTVAIAGVGLYRLVTSQSRTEAPPMPGEIRAVWLSLFDPFDLFCEAADPARGPSPAGVREVIDLVASHGINTVFVMVDSWYAYSIVEPTYEPKKSLAEWDAFGEVLRAAAARGIEVHLSFPLVNNRDYPDGAHQPPDFTPRCGGSETWRARYLTPDGTIAESRDNVCPSRPETRLWEARLLAALLRRYPSVQRLQLEEPGYDTRSFCVCDECRRQFAARYGGDLVEEVRRERQHERCPEPGCDTPAAALKCEHMTALIRTVREELAGRELTWSATVSYDRWRDRQLGRDWQAWTRDGWLDFIVPMIYLRDTTAFRRALQRGVLADLVAPARACAGIGLHFGGALVPEAGRPLPDINTPAEVMRQIREVREVAQASGRINGVSLFLGELLRPAYRARGERYLESLARVLHG